MNATATPQPAHRRKTDIGPQEGPQTAFLASSADIVVYGGAAGGGKTFGLIMEPMRHINKPGFGAVVFRREYTQITSQGGLWDEACKWYPVVGGRDFKSPRLGFRWVCGAKVTFAHLNKETDVFAWQGSQIALIEFDELTHFAESQFWYMLSRNRSTCGVRPYIRCTTNPDAESWVARLIDWWIGEDGFPTPERAGVVRWFVRVSGKIYWGDSPDIAIAHGMDLSDAKSFTFIPASISDNPALLEHDPGYIANLKALSRVERGRLLDGNWKIRPAAGMYFRRGECQVIDSAPAGTRWVRAWDLAATEPDESNQDPDWSVGVLLGRTPAGRFVVGHVRRVRARSASIRQVVREVAAFDGRQCVVALPQDPGQAGKSQAEDYVTDLAGYPVRAWPVTGDKVIRAEPIAAQWQRGNVDIVRGTWNDAFWDELEAFPTKGIHDDQVDALSLACYALTNDFRPQVGTTTHVRL